ncbi:MAG: hypothetical protein UT39_C0007G0020 [Candidatus Woesebacteria bacterium GW2011_GWA1_39_21]|uniref:Glycosyl transferase family 1 domain-containing protein n=1 Tax=Candidatus Woesebacteria bacterium GW2011_GWA1_39_21 TaxID=1618550 RepID=A0A0G0QM30_9BACT|nr:MAG: hypothetical protein UT39_C0007G0020 [Candidatus Woesebacteria bacterium GW2011_GWA1_39_21]
MKAAIYNPYWDTLGGGERYSISFAKVLVDLGYEVDIEWKDPEILKKIEKRFGLVTDNVRIVESVKRGDGYDLCFWVSDGSVPLLRSRNNILHFQVPFKNVNGNTLINRMKFFRIKSIICNSRFTKMIIDEEYAVKSVVVYPPCDISKIKPKRKQNLILFVGRFSQLLQSKRQDVLIDAFKKSVKRGLRDWRLVLLGGIEVGADEYLKFLKKKAKSYRVDFIEGADYKTLVDYYGKAKIFWSASGYGENELKNPEKVEHFGMSGVEAMAGGCVPLLYESGGHREIVDNAKNGYTWNKLSEFVRLTINLVSDSKSLHQLSKEAVKKSGNFSYEVFSEKIKEVLR